MLFLFDWNRNPKHPLAKKIFYLIFIFCFWFFFTIFPCHLPLCQCQMSEKPESESESEWQPAKVKKKNSQNDSLLSLNMERDMRESLVGRKQQQKIRKRYIFWQVVIFNMKFCFELYTFVFGIYFSTMVEDKAGSTMNSCTQDTLRNSFVLIGISSQLVM